MILPGSIDIDLLRTFVWIAETGTFTRAAELAGRSQSTISLQIKRLEALLGKRLFSRGKGHTAKLTPEGSHLLARATEMLALNDAIWRDFHAGSPPGLVARDDYTLPMRAQREAFTTQIMVTLLTNEKFTDAYARVMRCVENKITVDARTVTPHEDEVFMALLSMFEYISINFLSNAMDREIILRQRRTGLLRTYEVLRHYIDYKRKAWDRPNAYRSFEIVVQDYIGLYESAPAVSLQPTK